MERLHRHWFWVVFLIGTLHASTYAWLVTPWQAPDEPGHVEYACLLAEHGRSLGDDDRAVGLEAEIIASLAQHDFWTQVREPWPDPPPASFAADPFLIKSGRQVGDEPRLYYLLPAQLCRLDLPVETLLRLMRLYGALLFGLTGAAAAWAYQKPRHPQAQQCEEVRSRKSDGADFAAFGIRHSAFIVLLPMAAFIAGSANNDALAMLSATAVFAATARAQRLGLTWQRTLGLAALLVVALWSKKTNLFLLPWLAILLLAAGWRRYRDRFSNRRSLAAAAAIACALTVFLLLPSAAPTAWRGRVQPLGRGRVAVDAGGNGRAVQIVDRSTGEFGRIFQTIVDQPALALRGQTVTASAEVRSPDARSQPGLLTVRDAGGYSQLAFVAGPAWQRVELTHTVAPDTAYVKLALAPGEGRQQQERGSLLVDDVSLSRPGGENLLRNGGFEEPARWAELLLIAPFEDRWRDLGPRLPGGEAFTSQAAARYGLYTALLFPGFWGNFGWLQRPLPLWIYGLLAALCLAAASGVLKAIRKAQAVSMPPALILSWLLAVALIFLQTLLPMLGRDWQPQGRYLFPALFPITGLLLVGIDYWFNVAGHPRRVPVHLLALLAFDAWCLLGIAHAI